MNEKPLTVEEIAKDLNLHIEVVKYWLEMDIRMLKHPARHVDMSGDYNKEFIELGKKLRK